MAEVLLLGSEGETAYIPCQVYYSNRLSNQEDIKEEDFPKLEFAHEFVAIGKSPFYNPRIPRGLTVGLRGAFLRYGPADSFWPSKG